MTISQILSLDGSRPKLPLLNRLSLIIAALWAITVPPSGYGARALPPLPRGVTELRFNDFFATPVGPKGLQLTDKALALHGKRVRILGYMVRQEEAPSGSFLLAAIPVQLHDHDSALADDLPATAVHVFVSRNPKIRYTPQLLLLTGTLSVGNREETGGRTSIVRLSLDSQQPVTGKTKRVQTTQTRGGARALLQHKSPH